MNTNKSLIDGSLKALLRKGPGYSIKAALLFLIRYKLYLCREYGGYLLWIFGGPGLSLQLYLKVYRFLSGKNLLPDRKRRFWMGKAHRNVVLKEITIDPLTVKYEAKGGYVPYIEDGDWDIKKELFIIHESIREIFVNGVPPSATNQYRVMEAAVRTGNRQIARGCRNLAEVNIYFARLKKIYDYAKKHRALPDDETGERIPGSIYPDKILLSIDREGNYLLESGGTHRLSIAKLLELPKVKAVVIRKHYKYLLGQNAWLD